jgi:hypothetical protein
LIVDLDKDRAETVADEIIAAGGKALALQADVSHIDDVEGVLRGTRGALLSHWTPPDH